MVLAPVGDNIGSSMLQWLMAFCRKQSVVSSVHWILGTESGHALADDGQKIAATLIEEVA